MTTHTLRWSRSSRRSAFRMAVLAAAVLAASSGAIAAPGQPRLEINETEFRLPAPGHDVEVPVSWHQMGGDPADSVQYLVDGVPMRVLGIDPVGAASGGTTLSFGDGGEFSLSTVLCNADGCNESEPQAITIIDPDGHYLLERDQAINEELLAIAEGLEDSLEYYETIFGPRETWPSALHSTDRAMGWTQIARVVGQGLFSGAIGKVGEEGMGKILDLLGYGQEATLQNMQSALRDLDASMVLIHDKMDDIALQLDRLVDQIDDATAKAMWDTFRSNDNTLRLLVLPQIEDLFNLIGFWTEENPPTESLVERYVTDVTQAVRGIRTAVVGGHGTLAMLMEAHLYTETVSDLEDYWLYVDQYRDQWRAVLAQALLSLEYMRAFDESGYAAYQLESAREIADAVVEAMWSAGLKIAQHPVISYVHLKGDDQIMSRSATYFQRPNLPDEDWTVLRTRAELEPRALALVEGYRPDLNGGQTLEDWLGQRYIPTLYPFMDQGRDAGRIEGNSYRLTSVPGNTYTVAKAMPVQTNVGGRAASFDPDAVHGMAFGFDLDIVPRAGSTDFRIMVPNPNQAPYARVLNTETGEVLGTQPRRPGSFDTFHIWYVEPGSTITIQLGEHAVQQPQDLFGPVTERTLVVPDHSSRIALAVR